MKKLLLTGATGFIGHAILERLIRDNEFLPFAAIRTQASSLPAGVKQVGIGDISAETDWSRALQGVEFLVHTAAHAHIIKPKPADLDEFRRINTDASLNLARKAALNGVSRFVFISSIGVVGVSSEQPLSELDEPHPLTPYTASKLEAEMGLREIAGSSEMEIVIIRPPLVYGPDAPGNFARLRRILLKGTPLPFAAIENQRSFVALDNLVDFVITCLQHPAAANQTFHVSDGVDISTPHLLRLMAEELGQTNRMFWFPVGLLKLAAALLGKRLEMSSLCDSLQIDVSKAKSLLGWAPPQSLEDAMHKAFNESGD